jgi:hypothetical protein
MAHGVALLHRRHVAVEQAQIGAAIADEVIFTIAS